MHGTLNKSAKRVRSSVTSGKRLFHDHINSVGTPQGRRFHDLVNAYTADLGGTDRIAEATRNHVRRVAFLQCVLELREQEFVTSGTVSMEQTLEYQRTSNTQSRLMKRIGLFNANKKTVTDDDDDLDPLTYMKTRGKTRRERLEDDDD
jgi:hypothetical protein